MSNVNEIFYDVPQELYFPIGRVDELSVINIEMCTRIRPWFSIPIAINTGGGLGDSFNGNEAWFYSLNTIEGELQRLGYPRGGGTGFGMTSMRLVAECPEDGGNGFGGMDLHSTSGNGSLYTTYTTDSFSEWYV